MSPPTNPTAPSAPPEDLAAAENRILHNVALGVTPLAMGAMFLPPRRFDLRLIILGGVALWGTNQLVYDYTGQSSVQKFGARMEGLVPGSELPEKAQRTQMLMRQERERRAAVARDEARLAAAGRGVGADGQKGGSGGQEGGKDGAKGSLEAIWMGDAEEDWKERRAQREKAALQEGGGGIWGLIVDHISDVRSSGKQKRAEVLAAREEQEKKQEVEAEKRK
ncbi:hypothetical protein Micbo1qcDRAFT_232472 [Microdochium bolleyi]|uniref:Rhomboid family membrane protein n=1 Tax=Microdochium bolleyi TaxID=196109 RepID=A0A136J6Y2_9PEZI|nr:hypothetical protein Micbo1qcDRAFT_232472 [Microdochium bolleyi]